jgi:hypothetical protein
MAAKRRNQELFRCARTALDVAHESLNELERRPKAAEARE